MTNTMPTLDPYLQGSLNHRLWDQCHTPGQILLSQHLALTGWCKEIVNISMRMCGEGRGGSTSHGTFWPSTTGTHQAVSIPCSTERNDSAQYAWDRECLMAHCNASLSNTKPATRVDNVNDSEIWNDRYTSVKRMKRVWVNLTLVRIPTM